MFPCKSSVGFDVILCLIGIGKASKKSLHEQEAARRLEQALMASSSSSSSNSDEDEESEHVAKK